MPTKANLNKTFESERKQGRSKRLQGIALDVYRFIENNPLCTRDDVSRGLDMKTSTATARIKELIDDGFVVEPSGQRRVNRSGVSSRCLLASDRPQGGAPLDKIRIRVTLTIDHNGVYGAKAEVVDGEKQSGRTMALADKVVTIAAPHPENYAEEAKRVDDDFAPMSRVSKTEIIETGFDVIEGDFTEVSD
jgi:hypothetical protein